MIQSIFKLFPLSALNSLQERLLPEASTENQEQALFFLITLKLLVEIHFLFTKTISVTTWNILNSREIILLEYKHGL